MRHLRMAATATLLVVEAGLAVLGTVVHFGFTAEYGDITDSPWEAMLSGFSSGVSGLALVVVGGVAVVSAAVSSRVWIRLAAIAVPVGMVVGMFAVTPIALGQKLEQYDATPQCVFPGDMGSGPGSRAARESQRAFDSIEHVGYFGGGGASGVGGCDRRSVLIADVDVMQHYRVALAEAGWRVVAADGQRLRAERGGMAFEVVTCDREAVVWAGRADAKSAAQCQDVEQVGLGR